MKFKTDKEIRAYLLSLPEGTKFTDSDGEEYEVVIRDGLKRFRSTESGYSFPERAWDSSDDIEVEDTRSLYEKVADMKPGTIFRVGDGDPWIRTIDGVEDIHSVKASHVFQGEIPEGWKTYHTTAVTILWEPVA